MAALFVGGGGLGELSWNCNYELIAPGPIPQLSLQSLPTHISSWGFCEQSYQRNNKTMALCNEPPTNLRTSANSNARPGKQVQSRLDS